jgi:hypothetical protein
MGQHERYSDICTIAVEFTERHVLLNQNTIKMSFADTMNQVKAN